MQRDFEVHLSPLFLIDLGLLDQTAIAGVTAGEHNIAGGRIGGPAVQTVVGEAGAFVDRGPVGYVCAPIGLLLGAAGGAGETHSTDGFEVVTLERHLEVVILGLDVRHSGEDVVLVGDTAARAERGRGQDAVGNVEIGGGATGK